MCKYDGKFLITFQHSPHHVQCRQICHGFTNAWISLEGVGEESGRGGSSDSSCSQPASASLISSSVLNFLHLASPWTVEIYNGHAVRCRVNMLIVKDTPKAGSWFAELSRMLFEALRHQAISTQQSWTKPLCYDQITDSRWVTVCFVVDSFSSGHVMLHD